MDRIRQLQAKLSEWGVDRLLLENPIDLFYLTGLHLSKGRLVVGVEDATLFVDGRYFTYASNKSPCPVKLADQRVSGLQGTVGFDAASTTVAAWRALERDYPANQWIALDRPLSRTRAVKSCYELERLEAAAAVTWAGVCHVKKALREGISEAELAFEFEIYVRKRGASGLSFDPIIAFGPNSALPHHRASSARLQRDQIVLVDVGAVVDAYCGDVTRVFFFGDVDPRLKKMLHLTVAANQAAAARVVPGGALSNLDRAAREVFAKAGVEAEFVHGLGHGIGLETHEFPSIRKGHDESQTLMEVGMVFTIEPGLYRAGLGGVRYENTGVVTPEGFRSFYPEEPRYE